MKDSAKAIADTIRQSKEAVAELSEDLFDALNETKNDIPVVKWASAVLHINDSFQIAKLRRNTHAFVQALEQSELQRAAEFFEDIKDRNSEYMEVVIDLLLNSNASDASTVIGNLTASAVQANLSYDELLELSHVVSTCSAPALRSIPRYFCDRAADIKAKSIAHDAQPTAQAGYLVSTGLMEMNSMPQKPTPLALKLYIYGFNGSPEVAELVRRGKLEEA